MCFLVGGCADRGARGRDRLSAAGKPAAAATKSAGAPAGPKGKAASAAPGRPAATEKTDADGRRDRQPTTEAPRELDADSQADLAACPARAPRTEVRRRCQPSPLSWSSADVASLIACAATSAFRVRHQRKASHASTVRVGDRRAPHGRDYAPGRPVFVSFVQAVHYCNTVAARKTDPLLRSAAR